MANAIKPMVCVVYSGIPIVDSHGKRNKTSVLFCIFRVIQMANVIKPMVFFCFVYPDGRRNKPMCLFIIRMVDENNNDFVVCG